MPCRSSLPRRRGAGYGSRATTPLTARRGAESRQGTDRPYPLSPPLRSRSPILSAAVPRCPAIDGAAAATPTAADSSPRVGAA